ncbi:MAG: DUF2321 domain-containing protein [Hyphomicrobium sp.]|jgi:hypothetical protein|uniref:DUF2321 domain-containing protein n=1 Tax=Hyphomicrobium sp. TaxID=82 RepID=UPI0025B9ECBD|nr:DUF2321 domain-containing protein [Hyphomicrobium sp.]MBX9865018.1 DUF2321 domain-containing protein [Hyphomicrobium sp.]
MGHFDIGQVCLNGHEITGNYKPGSEFAEDYCSRCGAKTITQCPKCQTSIKGYFDYEGGVIAIPTFDVPAYCYKCGEPFPWISRAIQAAKELTDEIEGLNETERIKAGESLVEITKDTAQTEVAIVRIKKLLAKAGPVIGDGLKQIILSIATEAAKKQMEL